jgi:hypothetical protein
LSGGEYFSTTAAALVYAPIARVVGDVVFTVLMLGTVRVVWGMALALYYFDWPTLGASGLILTIIAVTLLHYSEFGLFAGVGIIVGCLSLNQIAYLIGTVIVGRGSEDSASTCVSSDARKMEDMFC